MTLSTMEHTYHIQLQVFILRHVATLQTYQ